MPAGKRRLGFLHLLRTGADGLLRAIQQRVELVSQDIEKEKLLLLGILLRATLVFMFGMTAVLFMSATVAYLVWPRSPLIALGALSVVHLCAAAISGRYLSRYVRLQNRPLEGTLDELKKDRA